MSDFTLKINTDNAAFEGDGKYHELPRILRAAADRIEGGDLLGTTDVRDVNGNRVGQYRYHQNQAGSASLVFAVTLGILPLLGTVAWFTATALGTLTIA